MLFAYVKIAIVNTMLLKTGKFNSLENDLTPIATNNKTIVC